VVLWRGKSNTIALPAAKTKFEKVVRRSIYSSILLIASVSTHMNDFLLAVCVF